VWQCKVFGKINDELGERPLLDPLDEKDVKLASKQRADNSLSEAFKSIHMTKQLNLICSYAVDQDELEMFGPPSDLQQLIQHLTSGKDETISLAASSNFYASDRDLFTQLMIKITHDNVIIEANNLTITITGSTKGLANLSQSIQILLSQENDFSSKHSHIEYFPGHPFIAPESEILTIYLIDEKNC
jgi:hypothetical protein